MDADGKVIGRHPGYCNFTIGQRKGLGVAFGTPKYVTRIDAAANEVCLGDYDDLYQTEVEAAQVRIHDVEWLRESPQVLARIRYKSPASDAEIAFPEDFAETGRATLHFKEPVWGVTPGQSVVLYKDGLVVGGGIIC